MATGRSISYEVYYQQDRRWHLQASFDSGKRDDAVEEAKRLEKEGHLQGACVIREAYDKATNLSHESIVYSSPGLKEKPSVAAISGADGNLKNAPEGSVAANAAREAKKREAAFQERQMREAEQYQAAQEEKKKAPALAAPPRPTVEPGAELVKIALAFLAASIGGTAMTTLCFMLLHMSGLFLGRNVTLTILAAVFGITFLAIFLPPLKKILAASKLASARATARRQAQAELYSSDAVDALAEDAEDAQGVQPANENEGVVSESSNVAATPGTGSSSPTDEAGGEESGEATSKPAGGLVNLLDEGVPMPPAAPKFSSPAAGQAETGKEQAEVLSFPTAAEIRASAVPVHVVERKDSPTGPEPMDAAIRKVVAEARQYLGKRLSEDAYTRFGVILFLAGFSEPLMLCYRVSKEDAFKVLVDNVMRLGVEEKQANGFCANIDEYLLDERYFGMYSLGRSGGNRRVADDASDSAIREAIKVWNSPSKMDLPGQEDGGEEKSSFVAVMFTDIVDSTEQQQAMGDEWLMKVIRAHNDIVREVLSRHQGREIKHTGDGIMASFNGVVPAVEAALSMQQGFRRFSEAMPNLAFQVRAGLSAGEPIHEDGDIFGTPVNLAARVMSHAQGGEVAVSSIVRELCRGKDFEFEQVGVFELKGFEEPQPVYHILSAKKADEPKKEGLP